MGKKRYYKNGIVDVAIKVATFLWRFTRKVILTILPMTSFKYPDAVVLIFAKAPIPGEVNTRLIPGIGVDAATQLQVELIHSRLESLKKQSLCNVELWCSPNSNHVFFQQCQKQYGVTLFEQQGDDLGERMSSAIKESLQRFKRVVLIGTDAPSLTTEHIETSIKKLDSNDVVIAPAEDGGYVLIGMAQHCDTVFQSVPWGTGEVLSCTRGKIKASSLVNAELEQCWDIDRVEDYQRYRKYVNLC